MALPAKPSLQQINDEFGVSTRSGLAQRGLREFYVKIIGAVTPLVSNQWEFEGYGRANISTISYSVIDGNNIQAQFTLTRNQLDTQIRIEWHEDDIDPPFTSQEISTTSYDTYTTDGVKQISTGQILEYNTTYWFRISSYNAFNDHVDDHDKTSAFEISTGSPPPPSPPDITNIARNSDYEWRLSWNADADIDSFTFRWRINGGTYSDELTFEAANRSNWGTATNPKAGDAQQDNLVLVEPGDTIEFEMKSERDSVKSDWSASLTYEEPFPEPTVTTDTATSVGTGSATLRGTLGNVAGEGYTCVYRWRYRVQGSGTWTNTGTANTGSDGQQTQGISSLDDDTTYEFYMQAWNQDDPSNVIDGNVRTFTTVALSTDPTAVTLVDNGANSQVTWNTPAAGNPGSYTVNISVNGGSDQNIQSGISGSATSTSTFNICDYGTNGDSYVVKVIANSPSGLGTDSGNITSFCF